MWTKMNVRLLEIFRCSETAFIFLGSNIQNNFITVCVCLQGLYFCFYF